ncbi:hypothetical protein GCM10020366_08250 [Saccharopolyspora gregorii]|uniref:Aldehyde dehydrogenase family protein n=1 Tax=Saccharopolyspora gregorii TaxID=33914 RepID=A0ABP6RHY2_9PSEU
MTSEQHETGRVAVAKTCKLYVGGKFPRSESGRVYPVRDAAGAPLANVAHASRKDLRDAVAAARGAFPAGPGPPPTTAGRCCSASPR